MRRPRWLIPMACLIGGCATGADDDGAIDADNCEHTSGAMSADATEVCDGLDNDCDGDVDEGVAATWYADADGDTYGDPEVFTTACERPDGHVADNTDCDDTDGAEHPGVVWYPDVDEDTFGQIDAAGQACSRAADTDVLEQSDCDDTEETTHPGASDAWYDGVDSDCLGNDDYDQDGDGYRSLAEWETGGDCDDVDADINPAGVESQDGADNDCDRLIDEGFIVPGDLVITEIMCDPSAVGDHVGEWFEVYNASGLDIEIQDGWGLSDAGSESHMIASPLTIRAGDYFVFGNNDDPSTNGGLTVDYDYGAGLYLVNSDDEVIITFNGSVIDAVAYDDTRDNWRFIDTAGYAKQLDRDNVDERDNDDSYNWCNAEDTYGIGDYGTPGEPNIRCPFDD